MPVVEQFIEITPTTENLLRGIVLFGRNVASYKFALAKSLLDLGVEGRESVSLEELAGPFAAHVCEQLREAPKQATSPRCQFLDACRQYNTGELDADKLQEVTTRLGFVNVIDASPRRVFVCDRRVNR